MRIGDFEIIATLGAGASGVVYKATNLTTKRVVALKELYTDSAETKARAIEEGRSMAAVASHHLVTIYNIHEIADRMYLESELVEGANLSSLISTRGLDAEAAERLLRELLEGLKAMHGVGLIHGDLKAENVMIRSEGSAVIIDLGLSSRGVATAMGGTSQFMAPEMFRPPHRRDALTDLYSLGMTMYEAVVGRPGMIELFPDILSGRGAALDHHWQSWALDKSTVAVPVDRIRPDIPESLAQLIADLMAKDPADRPRSASAALDRMAPSRGNRPASAPRAAAAAAPSRDRVTEISAPAAEPRSSRPLRTVAMVMGVFIVAAAVFFVYLRRPREVRIETIPAGATLLAGGKSLGKITPATVTIRGGGAKLTASRPGYKEVVFPVTGPMDPIRLEPRCAETTAPAGDPRILVGDGFPVQTLDGLTTPLQFVGNGCAHDIEANGTASTVSFRLPAHPNFAVEEWPLAEAFAERVQARLFSLATVFELALASEAATPSFVLMHKTGTPPRVENYVCCDAKAPSVEVNRDVVAFSFPEAAESAAGGPDPFLIFLEIGPDGEVTIHANTRASEVPRIPAGATSWLTVQPPRTRMQFFVALTVPEEPAFLPPFRPTDQEPFRLLQPAELERLRTASRERSRSWERRYSVFEVK